MIASKDRHKILNDAHLLSAFVREVKSAPDTPWLIRWVAGEASRMILCEAVVNAGKDPDPSFLGRIKALCQNQGIGLSRLQEPLQAVARSLGLVVSDSQVDFYALLGVSAKAESRQIRKAFRRKAYELHPDTRKDPHAETAGFIALNDAYQTLGDPVLRRQYDESRRNLETWKERAHPKAAKRRDKRLKPVYQLIGVLFFLVGIVFVSDMIYRENAMNAGYRPDSSQKPVSVKVIRLPDPPGLPAIELVKKTVPPPLSKLKTPPFPPAPAKAGTAPSPPKDREIAKFQRSTDFLPEKKSVDKTQKRPAADPEANQKAVSGRPKPTIFNAPLKSGIESLNPGEFIAVSDVVRVNVHGLSLRRSPNTDGKIIREMTKGEPGRVIGGPIRVDGFIWWQLKLTDGDTGWATEKKALARPDSTENLIQMLTPVPKSDAPLQFRVSIKRKKRLDPLPGSKPGPSIKPGIVRHPPDSKSLQAFLDRFCRTYEKRDLTLFAGLFTPDATENGQSFQSLRPVYQKTFRSIDRIDYQIQLLEHAVELSTRTIRIKGRFNLKWHGQNGVPHKTHGRMEMVLLQDREKGFLVKKMKYRYRS